jgi:hypothetical protein
MKKTFAGWYAKTPDELKALWDGAIIVPDTNIILHLIRHSAKVRNQLMDVFERKKEALWIPYQVGVEFQRRRLDVQQQASDAYDRLDEDIASSVNQAKNKLNQYRAHPVIEIERELSALDVYLSDFEQRVAKAKVTHPTDELAVSFDKVTELFEGRVGAKPSVERIVAIRKEGEDRYSRKIPPGFEDAKKSADSGDKFGDLIIWKEMIEKAKTDKRSMIFVTDDGKSDWWYIHRGRKIGPHPELVEEFFLATGQQFHIYELLQFLRYAADTGSGIQADAVRQIADTMFADSEATATLSAADRSRALKVLRAELRDRETELDGLVKSLIELPPKTAEGDALPRDDAKRSLKSRIGELTEQVNALRAQLTDLESTAEGNAAGM